MSNAPAPSPIRSKTLHPSAFPGPSTRTPFQSRLLLVEPEFDLSASRALLLTASSYSVTTVSSHDSVSKLHRDAGFSLAVLNDTLGPPALRSVAICVRRTWPEARILILRRVESRLEDHLYDETIDYPFRPKALLDALVKLADDPWNQRLRLFGASPGVAWGSEVPLPSSPSKPLESDPTKAEPHDLDPEKEYSPDTPGDEQRGQRA
ncbi:hypothetical protein HNQ77_001739 [Silvibacterium bohemicum]|uniref:Response regulatory domain-containing protein n=1 Tax=Silvibacterium bohemicum TaxID=1577686 RepID=A0A841JRK7_9BACT|nr:hypothetical protein [Silvibacterium bohemicum]